MYATANRLEPMSNDQLRRIAPSIFATEPESHVSDLYGFIPTVSIVEELRQKGFVPTFARQCNVHSRDENYTKHMLRFTLLSDIRKQELKKLDVGGEVAQICLVNSHDRSSSYQLDAALWRLVCGNGLMVCGTNFESIHVRHSRGVVRDVIEGTYRIIEEMPQVFKQVNEMKQIRLAPPQQTALAQAAAVVRWGEDKIPVDPERLLHCRRPEDQRDDLWTTFNRVQENLMRGGVRGRSTTGRRMTTHEIKSVAEDVRLNRALWAVADSMRTASKKRTKH